MKILIITLIVLLSFVHDVKAKQLSGKVITWGAGKNDFCIYPHYGQSISPVWLTDAIAISAGSYHTAVVRTNGSVVTFGAGQSDTGQFPYFGQAEVPFDLTNNIVSVAAGAFHTAVLTSEGKVSIWGKDTIRDFEEACDKEVTSISMTGEHVVTLNNDASIFATGNNEFLQCMVPYQDVDIDLMQIPTWFLQARSIAVMPGGISAIKLAVAGGYHTVVLTYDGEVKAWGANKNGQCNIPAGLTNIAEIAAGAYHTVALKKDGTVVAWGDNTYKQCTIPLNLTGVKTISAGAYHTVALKLDGTVVAWGRNDYGQCSVPVGLTNVFAISAGKFHTTAITRLR
jgi:alpha-tubulin suppressor-like RCC1 family protein